MGLRRTAVQVAELEPSAVLVSEEQTTAVLVSEEEMTGVRVRPVLDPPEVDDLRFSELARCSFFSSSS